jgi:hypothetical protein
MTRLIVFVSDHGEEFSIMGGPGMGIRCMRN